MTAEISTNLQKALRSNKLKRESKILSQKEPISSKQNKKIVESIIDKKPFIFEKTDNDYFDPRPQNAQQIQQEFEQDNKDFIQTALEFNKVDLAAAEDAKEKK